MKNTFPTFWQFLQKLVDLDCTCRTGGGPPDCKLRQCAKQKGVEICTQCKENPCKLIQNLIEHYPILIQASKRHEFPHPLNFPHIKWKQHLTHSRKAEPK